MQCFDFASRNKLIPLPTVTVGVVNEYLSSDPIPIRVIPRSIKGKILCIHNDDVYYRVGWELYKNDISLPVEDVIDRWVMWSVTHLYGDWILFNSVIFHTTTYEKVDLAATQARLLEGWIYFIRLRRVYKIPIGDFHAEPVLVDDSQSTQSMFLIGNTLNLFSATGRLRLHDDPTIYDCRALFRYHHRIYEITHTGIYQNGESIVLFDHTPITSLFARDEYLVWQDDNHCHVLNCITNQIAHYITFSQPFFRQHDDCVLVY